MPDRTNGLRVLVVDDEPLIRWAVRETLQAKGSVVTVAPDAVAALLAIDEAPAPFDVIVLDYRLPGTTGLELFHQIRGRSPRSGVVLVTALSDVEDGLAAQARAGGAFAVLAKPIDMNALPDLLWQAAHAHLPYPRLVSRR